MTDFQTIELNKDARGVATLRLNRADKNNAFDAQVIGELNAALAQVQDDAGIRLILRGRGKHFCWRGSGLDARVGQTRLPGEPG